MSKVTDRSRVSGWGAIFSSIDSRYKLYMRSSILSIEEIGAWWGALKCALAIHLNGAAVHSVSHRVAEESNRLAAIRQSAPEGVRGKRVYFR